MVFELHIFLWHITMAVLFVYGCISMALYFNSKRNLFLYYSLYIFLLSLYVFDKNSYSFQIPVSTFTKIFNWYLQILYHVIYFWFSLAFVNFFVHYPDLKKIILRYTYGIFAVGTIAFIYTILTDDVDLFISYFIYFHVPLVILGFGYWIRKILMVNEPMKYFYIPGIIFYILFSIAALYFTFQQETSIPFAPISFFYIAILIETSLFAIGMGYQTQQIFAKSLLVEKQLNKTQIELQEKLKLQLDQKDLENTINKLKITSLQGQMNSHFIFNILNSIKSFIIENDKECAVNFLNKYAKLIREYLKGSDLETNDLEDEIKTVQLYVELENLRLNNSLNFSVDIDNDLNLKSIKIPTHILIPFIENSIWKGLFRQKGEKNLSLSIGKSEEDIIIDIRDNGNYKLSTPNEKIKNNLVQSMQLVDKKIGTFNKSNDFDISYYKDFNEEGGLQRLKIPSQVSSLNNFKA